MAGYLFVHERIAEDEVVVVGTASYDGVAGLPSGRPTRHLGRTLVETCVADDRPPTLRPVVDLYTIDGSS